MNEYWYILKVLPGKERILATQFNTLVSTGVVRGVKRFVCPTEKEFKIIRKKKIAREKVIYSGYIYFETEKKLSEDEMKEIGQLPNVMVFLGEKKPRLMTDNDTLKILKDETLEMYNYNKMLHYSAGEKVKIIEGAFSTFDATIKSVDGDKVDVDVKIFGRETPVTLTIFQIQKY